MAVANHFLARGCTVWRSPDVLPLDAWLARDAERRGAREGLPRTLSGAEEWWLWREAVADATRDSALVGAAPLAEALRRADRLADDHGIDPGRWLAVGGAETRLLCEVQRSVRRAMRDLGADTALRLSTHVPYLGDERPVNFAGFHAPDAPRVRRLHDARRERGLPGDWWLPGAPASVPAVVHAGDETDEIERIAAWCVSALAASPASRLLVVATGGSEQREAIAMQLRAALAPRSLLEGTVDADLVAIEGGAPLAREALVGHALTSLAWLIEGLEFEDFSHWWLSPYGPLSRSAAARLDLWWRRRAPLQADARASIARLAQAAAEGLDPATTLTAKASAALSAIEGARASARVWAERFSAALAALRPDDGRPNTTAEQQAWLRFVALLDEFGGVARLSGNLDARRALRALRELAARTSWQPTTGDARVTVTPAQDDPIARYDGVWIAGLTADAWPSPPFTDPFIPLPALREAGVAAADVSGRLASAHAALAAWRATTDALVLSTPTTSGDLQLSPSPLLAAWPRHAHDSRTPWLALRVRRGAALERLDDSAGQSWPVRDALPGGTRSIELQAACPFRAHAELQLDARPLESPLPGIAPDERGRWLHRALEILWRQIGDSAQLGALPAAQLDEQIAQAVAAAGHASLGPLRGPFAAARIREARRLGKLIGQLMTIETSRPPFAAEWLEEERQVALGEARVRVRIDRVDRLANGGRVIIDYKSGSLPQGDWFGPRPTAAQLLVYAAALGDDVRALALVRVASPEPRFKGIAAERGLLPGVAPVARDDTGAGGPAWSRQLAEWRGQVGNLAREFAAGEAAVTPAKGACRYCHLAALCRVGDRAELDVEEAADD